MTEDSTATFSEYSMESFLRAVSNIDKCFGLETFFYVMDSVGKMKYLPGEPHSFTFTSIISEHDSRLIEPQTITDGHVDGPVETPTLILSRSKSYDTFEKY